MFFFFFVSSRRRHTRLQGDWSSDVCSSDLGVRRTFPGGTLMLIADHLNLMWRNPLIGQPEPGEQRFPIMHEPYDGELRALARAVAREAGIRMEEGVYAALLGPSYETPSEVRMLERL